MPVTLKTNSFKYRDDPTDSWSAALVQAMAPLTPAYEKIDELASEVGIVVDGNTCELGASAGQYIILKNSTITGKDDGLYTVASGQTIAAGGTVTAAMLSGPITKGACNDLKNTMTNAVNVRLPVIFVNPNAYATSAAFYDAVISQMDTNKAYAISYNGTNSGHMFGGGLASKRDNNNAVIFHYEADPGVFGLAKIATKINGTWSAKKLAFSS